MENQIAEQEIEAIKAIYDSDFRQETITIKNPWKATTTKTLNILNLTPRNSNREIFIELAFEYPEHYPDEPPLFKIHKLSGISSSKIKAIEKLAMDYANENVGRELIFDVADLVTDYITNNSSSTSFFENMNQKHELENKIKLEQQEQDLKQEQEKLLQEREAIQKQVQLELERKKAKLQQEKPRKKAFPQISFTEESFQSDSNFTPTLRNANILPTRTNGFPSIQTAWFTECDKAYLIETYELHSISDLDSTINDIEKQVLKTKHLSHPSIPPIFDFDISTKNGSMVLRILTLNYRKISLYDTLLLTTFSLQSSKKIIMTVLNILQDLGEYVSQLGDLMLENVFYDDQMNLIISGTSLYQSLREFVQSPKSNPIWAQPNVYRIGKDQPFSLWGAGLLFLQLLNGPDLSKFTSPLDCANNLPNTSQTLVSFVQQIMDHSQGISKSIKLCKDHTFLHERSASPEKLQLVKPDTISANSIDISFLDNMHTPKKESKLSRYHSDFQELEFLGRGGFGAVVKAKNLIDGRYYAIKKIKLNPTDKENSKRLLREVQTLSRLQSEYIVRYYQAWFEEADDDYESDDSSEEYSSDESHSQYSYDETDDWLSSGISISLRKQGSLRISRSIASDSYDSSVVSSKYTQILYIQMEYCEKKTLRDLIDAGIKAEVSWKYLRQILEGLGHLHLQGIIHRDLKPSNVFLDMNGRIKIGDFGLATAKREFSIAQSKQSLASSEMIDDLSLTSDIGTPVYIAPEILARTGKYNSKVDMYSLGIVFFEMIYPLTTGMQRAVVLRDLRNPDIKFPDDFPYVQLKDQHEIIKQLLDHLPHVRPSCAQLLQSPLVPANVEEEYINEDLLRVVRQRNPTYFSRLIEALFGQLVDVHKDYTYDFNGNIKIFHQLTSVVKALAHHHVLKVFTRHGAGQISTPIIIPKSKKAMELYISKRPAEFLDQNGDVVQLYHDLTVPFARTLCQSTEEEIKFPLKRYTIERVYRKNIAGGQPRSIEECDFDIVYPSADKSMIPEAEVIKVVFEILEFGKTLRLIDVNEYQIRVNHTQNLSKLISSYGISDSLCDTVIDILAQLHKPLNMKQVAGLLSQIGLSQKLIEKLISLDVVIPITSKSKPNDLDVFFEKGFSFSKELLCLTANLENMGLKNIISFEPLLVCNPTVFHNSFIFQVCRKVKSKYDVIAVGGRYESLLDTFRGPFERRMTDLNCIGINFSLSKFILNITTYQTAAMQEDRPNLCKKADVVILTLGDNPALIGHKLLIANDLWAAGISADLSQQHIQSTQDEIFTAWKNDYTFAIIIKPKGSDSHVIKLRNLNSKQETEVPRSSLIYHLKSTQDVKRSESESDLFNTKHTVTIIPFTRKKDVQKYKTNSSVISEKSIATTSSLYQNSPIIAVELQFSDIVLLGEFWFEDEEIFKKACKSANRDYCLQIKRQVVKQAKESELLWIYSNMDSKSYPILV
ncbi:hypothetical protein HDV06_006668 [Boothiomyces sp. JEL0866]|nr:hypothetical protein HDV06_006668 [Boothiomyces sp. JEL0866]